MTTLPADVIADIHIIRQDYAKALCAFEADPRKPYLASQLQEVEQRRARAIRMIREEDGASVRDLAGMFRCSKAVVRVALEGGE